MCTGSTTCRGQRTERSEHSSADFFAQLSRSPPPGNFGLSEVQRPHLEALRELSLDADPEAGEQLKWNLPAYVRGNKTSPWMLPRRPQSCGRPSGGVMESAPVRMYGHATDFRRGARRTRDRRGCSGVDG